MSEVCSGEQTFAQLRTGFTRTMNAVGDNVLLPCVRVVKSGVVAMLSGHITRTHFSQSRRRLHSRSDNGRHHHSDNGRLGQSDNGRHV